MLSLRIKVSRHHLDVMTVGADGDGVSRRKTTVHLDSDVLTATNPLAAARGCSESRVIEDALRAYLPTDDVEAAHAGLRDVMDRLAQRAGLDDESAMTLAVEEVGRARATRRPAATR